MAMHEAFGRLMPRQWKSYYPRIMDWYMIVVSYNGHHFIL